MARERSIVLRLKAEVSDYQQKINAAARTLSDFEREQQKMGGAATTTLGRMVQSAKANEQAWTSLGRTLLTGGTAAAAMGTAVLKTGIEYNAMRQRATQALTAVTGSTEVAEAQLRSLDSMGRDSWLMRPTLIRAQTQMTGFGIETRKVIPYMEALQDAVAATGGTNQDFEELARLMGQIQSQGKITARELMQFGMRGIDAAQLIGDAMGKTAGQIRSEITAGTLDAGAALDALAQGMGERFAGASDLVRETWSGAVDNIKAAFRDLAGALATPLVDPDGGGLLVDWVNGIASSLNSLRGVVEGMPGWMNTATLALGGLGTSATIAAGAFAVGFPKYVRFREEMAALAATHPNLSRMGGALATVGKHAAIAGAAFMVASVGFTAYAKHVMGAAASTNEMSVAMRDHAFDVPFQHLTGEYNSFGDALRTLTEGGLLNKMDRGLGFVVDALTGGRSAVTQYREAFDDMGRALIEVADSGSMEQMAEQFNALAAEAADFGVDAEELLGLMPLFRDHLIGVADAAGLATDDATLLAIATGELDATATDTADAVLTLEERLERLTDAQRATLDAGVELAGNLRSTREAFIDWAAAIGDGDFVLSDWLKSIEKQNRALLDWDANMVAIKDRGAPQALLDQLLDMGVDGAQAVAALADANEKDFKRAGEAAELARDLLDGVGVEYDGLSEKDPIEIRVDADGAILAVNTLTGEIEDITPTLRLDADPTLAEGVYNDVTNHWQRQVTPTLLDADPKRAETTFADVTSLWERTYTATLLDADDTRAGVVFNQVTGEWERTTTDTNLDLDPFKAENTFERARNPWARTTTDTNLGLSTSAAEGAFESFRQRMSGRTITIGATVKNIGFSPAKFDGGRIPTVPGLQAGGRVPGARAGYDNVMWPLHSGGQVLGQPLEGGEFVVRSSQANRPDYAPVLHSMNQGTYQPAGGAGISRADMYAFARIVAGETAAAAGAAVREGAAVGVGGVGVSGGLVARMGDF